MDLKKLQADRAKKIENERRQLRQLLEERERIKALINEELEEVEETAAEEEQQSATQVQTTQEGAKRSAETKAQSKVTIPEWLTKGKPTVSPFKDFKTKQTLWGGVPYTAETTTDLDRYFAERKPRVTIANEEVERRYGQQLRLKKAELNMFENMHRDPRMGNAFVPGRDAGMYDQLLNEYTEIKKKADELRTAIITEGDPNVQAARTLLFDYIGNDLLDQLATAVKDAENEHYQNQKRPDYKPYDQTDQSLTRSVLDRQYEYDRTSNRINRLANYVEHFGLSLDTETYPEDIRNILSELAPELLVPENVAELNNFSKKSSDYLRRFANAVYEQQNSRTKQSIGSGNAANNVSQEQVEQLYEDQKLRTQLLKSEAFVENGSSFRSPWVMDSPDVRASQMVERQLSHALRYKKIADQIATMENWVDKNPVLAAAAARTVGGAATGAFAPLLTGAANLVLSTGDAQKFIGRAVIGEANKVLDIDTWTGIESLTSYVALNNVKDKLESGLHLTKDEQSLLDATAVDNILHDKYASYENDTAYKWGSIAGESVPFMADFIVTHGAKSVISGVSREGTKQASKAVLRGLAEVGKDELSMFAKRKAVSLASKAGTLLGDATYSAFVTNTVQLPRTTKDIVKLHVGDVDYDVAEDGSVVGTGFKNGLSWGESIRLGETRQWIENFSEQIGEWGIAKWLGKEASFFGKKIPQLLKAGNKLSPFVNFVKKLNPREHSAFVADLMEKAQMGGLVGEVGEEYWGVALNHLFNSSDAVNEDGTPKTLWEDLFDKQQLVDIVGGIGLSLLSMGMIGAGNYVYHRNKFDNASRMASAYFGKRWENIENAILNADYNNLPVVVSNLIRTSGNKYDARYISDYYSALMGFRGASISELKKQESLHKDKISRAREKAYNEGYSIDNYILREDIKNAHNVATENVKRILNISDEELSNTDLRSRALQILNQEETPDEVASALLAYQNLDAALDGINQREFDDLQTIVDDATKNIQLNFMNENNEVVSAKTKSKDGKEAKEVYIVRGDINKDKKVVVFNPEQGGNFVMDSEDIDKESVESNNVYDVMAGTAALIYDKYSETLKQLSTSLGMNPGDQHITEDGKIITVLGPSRDGGILYSIAEQGSNEGVIQQQKSPKDFNDFIKNINENRARQTYQGVLDAALTTIQQPQSTTETPEEKQQAEIDARQAIADETKNSKSTAFIPLNDQRARTNYNGEDKKKAAATNHKVAKQVAQTAVKSESFLAFLQALKDDNITLDLKYTQRLERAYKALKKGQISHNMFALMFVPEDQRKFINTKRWGKRFDDFEIDDDGNVTEKRQTKDEVAAEKKELIQDKSPQTTPEVKETKTAGPTTPSLAPTTTNAGAAEAAAEKTPQQAAVDKLMSKVTEDKANVLTEQTTAHDYFIMVDGKRRMYNRVHSVIDAQYIPDSLKAKREKEAKEQLEEAYRLGLDAFKKVANKLTKGLVEIGQYLSYIEENPGEYEDVIEAISWLYADTNRPLLKPEYEGKLIFVEDGGGKSTIKKYNRNVVDSDDILKELAPDGFDRIALDQRGKVMEEYNKRIRQAVKDGKTVLTANIQMLEEADVVIYNESPEETTRRTNAEDRENRFSSPSRAKQHFDKIKAHLEAHPDVESHVLSSSEYAANILTSVAKKPPLVIGSMIDELYRSYFGGENVEYEKYSRYMSKEEFDNILSQLKFFKDLYAKQGWTLITEPTKFYGEYYDNKSGRIIRVCGETDMIAIDKFGRPHIIDFKTSKYGFDASSYDTKHADQVRSSRAQHSLLLSMYSMMSSEFFGVRPSIEVLPTQLLYDDNLVLYNGSKINNRIPLDYADDVFGRFTDKEEGQIRESCLRIAKALASRAFVELGQDDFNVSEHTQQMIDDFVEHIRKWLEIYNSDGITIDDLRLLQKDYADIYEERWSVLTAIRDDFDQQSREEAEQLEIVRLEKDDIIDPLTWDDVMEGDQSSEQLFDNDSRAALEYNLDALANECRRIQQEHWDDTPDRIPEDLRKLLDQLMANIDELLIQTPVDQWTLRDYQNTKSWLARTLSINGTSSTPQVPVLPPTPPSTPTVERDVEEWKKYNTTKKADVERSVAIDNPNLSLGSVANKPDFIEKAEFIFTSEIPQGKTTPSIYLTVKYGGHTFTKIRVFTASGPKGISFYHSVIDSVKNAAEGKVVKPNKVRRTNGLYRSGKKETLASKKLVSNKRGENIPYIYDIEFTSNQATFAVVRINKDGQNKYTTVVTTPGDTARSKRIIYVYSNSNTNKPTEGTVIYMLPLQYNEVTGTKPQVPVALNPANITKEDAELIVGILTGQYTKDKTLPINSMMNSEFCENEEGKGLTCREVLDMFIPFEKDKSVGKPLLHVEFDKEDAHIVHIIGRVRGDEKSVSTLPDRQFNLSTESGRQKMISFLKENVTKNIDLQDFALRRLGQHPKIVAYFNKKAAQGLNPKEIKLTFGKSTLSFEYSDMRDESNPKDNAGLSGLGWYIKHGYLETQFDDIDTPLFEFDDSAGVSVVNETKEEPKTVDNSLLDDLLAEGTVLSNEIPDTPEEIGNAYDGEGWYQTSGKQDLSINEERARKRLHRILGNVPVAFEDGLLRVLRSGAVVVGQTWVDHISLSRLAEEGDEFHEAFHRVVELLFPESVRKRVYAEYRRVKGKELTDHEVREGLSEEFKYFGMNIPTFKMSYLFRHLMRTVKEWVAFIKSLGSVRLFALYSMTNMGAFRWIKPSKSNLERASKIVPFNKEIRGKKFAHVVTESQYKELINTMVAIFLDPTLTGKKWDDINPEDIKINLETLTGSRMYQLIIHSTKLSPEAIETIKEAVANFDAIQPDIVSYIQLIATDPREIIEQDNNKAKEGVDTDLNNDTTSEGDVAESQLDQHTKSSYEFDPFTRVSQKVKWFFAGIPVQTYGEGVDSKGNRKKIYVLNSLGLVLLTNPKTVYAKLLNTFREIKSPEDFLAQCRELGKNDCVFDNIANRFEALLNAAYDKENPDADKEAFVSQLYGAIKQTKNNFDTIKASSYPGGRFTFNVFSTDQEYSSREYVQNWSQNFAYGGCRFIVVNEDGSLKMGISPSGKTYSTAIFSAIQARISSMTGPNFGYKYLFSSIPNKQPVVINGRTIDIDNPDDIRFVKENIITLLNSLGIVFNRDMFDYMLQHKFGDTGKVGLQKFFEDDAKVNIEGLGLLLNGIHYKGELDFSSIGRADRIFNKNGFVKELAKWKYEYQHVNDQLSVLVTNNNKFYVMSENNLITDRLDELETDKEFLDELANDKYVTCQVNSTESAFENSGKTVGSLIVKHLREDGHRKLQFHTLAGFKTDLRGDAGIDYSQISDREDYLSKIAILQSGGMLFPTMSDKKTYGAIFGLRLPGLDYGNINGSALSSKIEYKADGTPILSVPEEVLDQMIEYCITEDASIRHFLDNPVKDEEKVDNYHKGQTQPTGDKVQQGGRYNFLLGVYAEDGTYKEFNRTLDEDGNYVDEEACYQRAHKYFFDKSVEEQRKIIQELLSRQLLEELSYIEELGLIKRVNTGELLLSYLNIGLDQATINKIISSLTDRGVTQEIESLAIAIYVNDMLTKEIMSIQEVCRCFSGNTTFFKQKYIDGHLTDMTGDWFKRLGGLISTGQANNPTIPGMPKKYTCAEVDDAYMIPRNIEELGEKFYECELRYAYHSYLLSQLKLGFDEEDEERKNRVNEIAKKARTAKKEDIEEALKGDILDIVKRKAAGKKKAFLDGVNIADGASYISDKMCENLLRQVGSYGNDVKRAFKILRGEEVDGKVYGPNDIVEIANAYHLVTTAVIGTLKYTAYGFRFQNSTAVPYYNKTALFPLFKCIATGNMAKVYKAMTDQGVDMLMMKSAVKIGGQGSQAIDFDKWHKTEGDGKVDFNDLEKGFKFNTYQQEYSKLRKQFNTDPKEKELMSMGTQMTKIALSSLLPGATYKVGVKEYTATQVRDNIMRCLREISDFGYEKLKERFFDEDNKLDIDKFSDFLTEQLANRGANRNILDSVSAVNSDKKDDDGNHIPELKLPMDAISSMNWVQSIINSIINDEVIDTNLPGKAFYQRSVWGMEDQTQILGDEDLPQSINGGNKLQMVNEEGTMDCVLSIDFFMPLLKQAGLENASFTKQKQWLIKNGIIGGSSNMVGYRIPTQAISSIHALRCVDVLPVVRDTVIFPAEFTKITGSDFDIDKIFISFMTYKVQNGNIVSQTPGTVEYSRNELLRNYIAILSDTGNAMHMLNASIDGDTKLLTDVLDELGFAEDKNTVKPFESFTLRKQSSTKNSFITGKFGIGPFALNNNNHILTMLYGVEFNDNDSLLKDLGMTSLHETTDRYGESIMSWLSGLINMHVDVAKDPRINKLGVNKYTYNLVNLMIRLGFGRDTFYFTTQPIMKQFAKAYENASGVYMQDKTKSKTSRQKEEIEKVWLNALNSYLGVNYDRFSTAWDQYIKDLRSRNENIDIRRVATYLMSKNGADILKDISKRNLKDLKAEGEYSFNIDGRDVTLSVFDIQMIVAYTNAELEGHSQALADLVKYSKIDTKKQGKNVTQLTLYDENYKAIFEQGNGAGSYFKREGLRRMNKLSYILTKTRKAVDLFKAVLSEQMIEATPAFLNQVKTILSVINKRDTGDEKIVNTVIKAIKGKIKSRYFFEKGGYCDQHNIDPKSLFVGNNSIFSQLIRILAKILGDPKYKQYGQDGIPNNYLLRTLVTAANYNLDYSDQVKNTLQDTYEGAKFVKVLNFLSDDTIDQDLFTSAWEELLNDSSFPEGQKFAEDLIVYAMIASADNGGKDIFKYVPVSWKLNENGNYEDSYGAYIYRCLNDYKKGDVFLSRKDIDDIVLNNWWDENMVPTFSVTKPDGRQQFTTMTSSANGGIPLILSASYTSKKGTRYTMKSEKCPQYIKVARPSAKPSSSNNIDGQRRFIVYKHVASGKASNGTLFPIYQIIDPKGTKFSGGDTIYEYERSDSNESEAYNLLKSRVIELAISKGLDITKFVSLLSNIKSGMSFVDAIVDFIDKFGNYGELSEISSITLDYYDNIQQEREMAESLEEMFTDVPPQVIAEAAPIKYVNHSGGAVGSDSYWDEIGQQYGVQSNHYYHGQKTPKGNIEISEEEFEEGKQHVLKANETLNRKPEKYMNLLARNYLLVKHAGSVFAIGHLKDGIVDGGTGWAVQMAIDDGKPVYVYDQERDRWYSNINGQWSESDIPILTPNFAGIGTRQINTKGVNAIKTVYNKTFGGVVNPADNTYPVPNANHHSFSNTPKATGNMTFSYGNNKRSDVKALTTFDAILSGERTATTRYESDGHIDYWKQLQVGDVVKFKDGTNREVLVRITKPLTKLSENTSAEEWSKKEGWSVDYFNSKVKPKISQAWQMEYELVPSQAAISNNNQHPFANIQGENISSDGSEFAKKLTNPGNNLLVEYKGKIFRNAEHAYQTWKSGEFDQVAYENGERGAFKPKGIKPVNKATSFLTMVEILTAKLQQHPELMLGILERGGIFYLLRSTHNVIGDKFWESSGQNGFMKALRQAYNNVINSSNYDPFNDPNEYPTDKMNKCKGGD